MKKNFKYAMMMATALVLGFSSCSSDDNDPIEGGEAIEEGVKTYASIKITAPQTYANSTVTGTSAESKINKVDVFIYDTNGYLKNHQRFDAPTVVNDNTGAATNVWTLGTMKTTTGSKQVFAMVNNRIDLDTTNKAQYDKNLLQFNTVRKLTSEVLDGKVETLAESSKFVMSSDVVSKSFIEWDGDKSDPTKDKNEITIEVKRLVAKIAVVKDADFDITKEIEGGKFTDKLDFTVGQTNTEIYAAQKINNNNDRVEDPNFYNDNYLDPADPDFKAPGKGLNKGLVQQYLNANESSTVDKDLIGVYAPENTALKPITGDLTYVSIKTEFIPSAYTVKNGDAWDPEPNTTTSAMGFWAIKTLDNGNFYFKNKVTAETFYKEEIKGDANYTMTDTDKKNILEYANGVCYFTVFPNKDNKYDVLRNDFYKINVTKINGLGETGEGPLDPNNPGNEIGINTHIDISIEVLPWTLHTEDHELTPQ